MTVDSPDDASAHPFKNQRIRFYLDNYHEIETWARLRQEANPALYDLFLDLVDTLSRDAVGKDDKDIDVRADEHTNPKKPRITVTHRRWQDSEGIAPAAVVVEWHRSPIDESGHLQLYVGIRVGDRRNQDQQLLQSLRPHLFDMRRTLGPDWEKESESFPLWRWIGPGEGKRLDEVALVAEARRAVWDCWRVPVDLLDRLIKPGP